MWMTLAMLAHGVERGRPLVIPDEVGVAVVLEDRHAVGFGELEHFDAAGLGQDACRSGSARSGWCRCISARTPRRLRSSSALESASIRMPSLVERDADDVDAEPRQPVDRALVAVLLDDDGVAARQQHAVDQIERLQRAGGDQDVVGGAGDAGVALELLHQEFAQRPVALRATGEAVGRKRAALALEHRVRRRRSARRAAVRRRRCCRR